MLRDTSVHAPPCKHFGAYQYQDHTDLRIEHVRVNCQVTSNSRTMPLNWVKYPVSGVLSPELTTEDLEFVTFGRIHEYYQGVKLLWLIRTNHLPNDLRTKIQETTPSDVCQT